MDFQVFSTSKMEVQWKFLHGLFFIKNKSTHMMEFLTSVAKMFHHERLAGF